MYPVKMKITPTGSDLNLQKKTCVVITNALTLLDVYKTKKKHAERIKKRN